MRKICKVISMIMVLILIYSTAIMGKEVTFASEMENEANDNFIKISTVEDMKNIANNLSGSYILECDLYLNTSSWEPIGTKTTPFTGHFDGNGHTIYGLNGFTTSQTYRGLFGYCGKESIIERLVVEMDEGIDNLIDTKYRKYAVVGMIAGYSSGEISYCAATGRLKCGKIDSRGGASTIGLICGVSYGVITCCMAKGYVAASNGGNLTYGNSSAFRLNQRVLHRLKNSRCAHK